MHLLSDYTINARTRYEDHALIYTGAHGETIELRGFLAAALLAVLIVDTGEGDARGIALDSDEQRADFFARYDREVIRDDWAISLPNSTNCAITTSSSLTTGTASSQYAPINAFFPSRWNCW